MRKLSYYFSVILKFYLSLKTNILPPCLHWTEVSDGVLWFWCLCHDCASTRYRAWVYTPLSRVPVFLHFFETRFLSFNLKVLVSRGGELDRSWFVRLLKGLSLNDVTFFILTPPVDRRGGRTQTTVLWIGTGLLTLVTFMDSLFIRDFWWSLFLFSSLHPDGRDQDLWDDTLSRFSLRFNLTDKSSWCDNSPSKVSK